MAVSKILIEVKLFCSLYAWLVTYFCYVSTCVKFNTVSVDIQYIYRNLDIEPI